MFLHEHMLFQSSILAVLASLREGIPQSVAKSGDQDKGHDLINLLLDPGSIHVHIFTGYFSGGHVIALWGTSPGILVYI